MTINEQTGPDPANKLERGRSDPTRSTRLREARRLTGPLVEPLLQFIERVPRDLDSLKARSKAAYKKAVEIVADVGLEVRQRGLKYTVTEVAELGVGVRIDVEFALGTPLDGPDALVWEGFCYFGFGDEASEQVLMDSARRYWLCDKLMLPTEVDADPPDGVEWEVRLFSGDDPSEHATQR